MFSLDFVVLNQLLHLECLDDTGRSGQVKADLRGRTA